MHRVLKGSGSTAMDHAHCLEMGQIGVVQIFFHGRHCLVHSHAYEVDLSGHSGGFGHLNLAAAASLASGGFSAIAYGTSVSQCGAYVLFIKKL